MSQTKPLYCAEFGDPDGPTVVFLHGLGLDHSIWLPVIAQMPQHLRILAIDLPGHGQSLVATPVSSMGAIVRRVELALASNNVQNAVCVGHCLGGLAAQGLAVKRLDLIRALVLNGTAAKVGHPPHWDKRIQDVKTSKAQQVRAELVEKWISRRDLDLSSDIQEILTKQTDEDFMAAMSAIRGTDFYTQTAGLRLPALGIAGFDDAFTPPDMVKETTDLIPGSRFQLLHKSGHISCFDQAQEFAMHLSEFFTSIGHTGS